MYFVVYACHSNIHGFLVYFAYKWNVVFMYRYVFHFFDIFLYSKSENSEPYLSFGLSNNSRTPTLHCLLLMVSLLLLGRFLGCTFIDERGSSRPDGGPHIPLLR